MKCYMSLFVGVLCLAVIVVNVQAQSTEGFQYFAFYFGNNNKLLAIDQNGNGFLQGGVWAGNTYPVLSLGNFWGNTPQPEGVKYLLFHMPSSDMVFSGETIIAILPNGDIWTHPPVVGDPDWSQPPIFVGNFWGGAPTSTSKSTWGGVKEQFKK